MFLVFLLSKSKCKDARVLQLARISWVPMPVGPRRCQKDEITCFCLSSILKNPFKRIAKKAALSQNKTHICHIHWQVASLTVMGFIHRSIQALFLLSGAMELAVWTQDYSWLQRLFYLEGDCLSIYAYRRYRNRMFSRTKRPFFHVLLTCCGYFEFQKR